MSLALCCVISTVSLALCYGNVLWQCVIGIELCHLHCVIVLCYGNVSLELCHWHCVLVLCHWQCVVSFALCCVDGIVLL